MRDDLAIKVENLSKTFEIPHEKITSIRGAFVGMFNRKTYEKFDALKDVSFEIKKGDCFGIVGRNGSGKSTLLKVLAGIYKPDEGNTSINGKISPFLELGIGFHPDLSGRDNIYLNATVLGLSKKEIDAKFDEIVDFSELERFIDQKIKNYSSGMKVRLAFSVAIHARREILLMDEVLAVGDFNFQQKCLDQFNNYRKLGKTVVLVSHDISAIQRHCNKALLLRNGKIEAIGTGAEISDKYIFGGILENDKKRTENAEKQKFHQEDKKRHSRVAEITKVELADTDNNVKDLFKTGEKMKIIVHCDINKKIESPIFGIVISNDSGSRVFASNTQYKKIDSGLLPEGRICIEFSIENRFGPGIYYISPAIALDNKRPIHIEKDIAKFNILNSEYNSNAIADFKHDIIIKKIEN